MGEVSSTQRKRKTAVILIHGMGEQVPMDTLRGFVESVWVADPELISPERLSSADGAERTFNPVWGKPDPNYDYNSFELRRITTERGADGRACDFYEFYWADLLSWTDWHHIRTWVAGLLLRRPSRVPSTLMPAWIFLWLLSLGALALIAYGFIPKESAPVCAGRALCWTDVKEIVFGLGGIVLAIFINFVFMRYVADVSRYLEPRPPNISTRHDIRERGITLLDTLIASQREDGAGKYDRIVVVGHSLGAVIGYDVLKYSFARWHDQFARLADGQQPCRVALEEMLRRAEESGEPLDLAAFQAAQDQAREEFVAAGGNWIVSDFITLGSPLGLAEVIMAHDQADMRRQQDERVLPTCPPVLEKDLRTKLKHFTYWSAKRRSDDDGEEARFTRIPHHAAHFAFTKWTNLYSPSSAVFWGDVLSAPAGGAFGQAGAAGPVGGIRDIAVLTPGTTRHRFISHTHYWNLEGHPGNDPPFHVRALRTALNLSGTKSWGDVR